jgi:hypothetical protein
MYLDVKVRLSNTFWARHLVDTVAMWLKCNSTPPFRVDDRQLGDNPADMPHEPAVLILAATLVVLKILCTKPLSTSFTQKPTRYSVPAAHKIGHLAVLADRPMTKRAILRWGNIITREQDQEMGVSSAVLDPFSTRLGGKKTLWEIPRRGNNCLRMLFVLCARAVMSTRPRTHPD